MEFRCLGIDRRIISILSYFYTPVLYQSDHEYCTKKKKKKKNNY